MIKSKENHKTHRKTIIRQFKEHEENLEKILTNSQGNSNKKSKS